MGDQVAQITIDTVNRPGFRGGFTSWEDEAMNKSKKFSLELRERAVRMVQDHRGEYPSL